MKRRIYMNHGTNVQMYATESSSSSNTNNCASGCGSCDSNGSVKPPVGGGAGAAVGLVIAGFELLVNTSSNPDD